MRARGTTLLPALLVAWTTAPAQAEWVVTPYLGINLAGNVEFRRGGPGGSIGYFGDRLGFEVDFQRYHHFFKDEDIARLVPENCRRTGAPASGGAAQPCADLNTDAAGLMGNLVAPLHRKSARTWRPYAVLGLGVIHAWVEDPSHQLADTDQNNLGFDLGGGVMYSLSNRFRLRADARYFRVFVDEKKREGGYYGDYGFLRATVGISFAFGK